jgi:sugar (pentulose or hexulose) kinase
MPQVYCGIDAGTQGVRCAMVRDDGLVVSVADRPLPPSATGLPEGWFEQEPGSWLHAAREAVAEAAAGLDTSEPMPDRVAGVSVTSTSGTLVMLDEDHRPVAPAIMYSDRRGAEQARRAHHAAAEVADALGHRIKSSFGLPKILWVKEKEPELFERTALFCSPTDYLIGWLTGRWGVSDQTNMLKFGYDVANWRWPGYIEAELGIPRDSLPEVSRSGTEVGTVSRACAGETGLPAGTPVAAGVTDGCAAQIAAGAVAPGQFATTIGTTMVVKGASRDLIVDPAGRAYCHRSPEGWWLPGGASNTGAEYLAREFTPDEVEQYSDAALQHSPTDLLLYPLCGRGERFPFADPDATGFLVGKPSGDGERFAAALEGVACLERLAYETLEDLGADIGETIAATGGGARSDTWLQIRADTMDRRVRRPEATDSAVGAAIVAATIDEYLSLSEAARAMVRVNRTVEPRGDQVGLYGELYERFVEELIRRGYVDPRWPG